MGLQIPSVELALGCSLSLMPCLRPGTGKLEKSREGPRETVGPAKGWRTDVPHSDSSLTSKRTSSKPFDLFGLRSLRGN